MFALIFKAGEVAYGIDVSSVLAVAPAFDFEADSSRALPFVGWSVFENKRVPVFDFNFMVTRKRARRLFGTRHILFSAKLNGKTLPIALVAESVSQVSEISEESLGETIENFSNALTRDGLRIRLADIDSLLRGILFDYEQ